METLKARIKNDTNKQVGREKLTVLIVDKKQVNTVLEQNIMDFGNKVIVAECYSFAIQAATKTRTDLITINMNLPCRDGIKMVSKIKEVVGASNVVSTDRSNYDIGQKVKDQQILYYIVKPLEVNEIQSILEHISRKKFFSDSMPN